MPRMARRARRVSRRRRRRRVMLVGGLVAFGTYKLSTRDAQRIEEHTGVDPEELTDAELEQAMSDLNIESQTVTSADTEDGSAPAGGGASTGTSPDLAAEISKLADLHDKGILTDEEFASAKRKALDLN